MAALILRGFVQLSIELCDFRISERVAAGLLFGDGLLGAGKGDWTSVFLANGLGDGSLVVHTDRETLQVRGHLCDCGL